VFIVEVRPEFLGALVAQDLAAVTDAVIVS
jgi:hypothetical protein